MYHYLYSDSLLFSISPDKCDHWKSKPKKIENKSTPKRRQKVKVVMDF